MKKMTLYNIINICLAVVFVALMLLQSFTELVGGISMSKFWFPLTILLVGISLLIKSIIFNSDSTFWFSLVLLFVFASVVFMYFMELPYVKYWPIFIEIPALASFIVGIMSKQWFHYKISIILTAAFFPTILYTLEVLRVWWFILVISLSIGASLYIISLLPEKFVWKKGKKNE